MAFRRLSPRIVAAAALALLLSGPALSEGTTPTPPPVAPAAAPAAPVYWGAVAFSETSLAWSFTRNDAQRADAEILALQSCQKNDVSCHILTSASNTCMALVTSAPEKAWGATWSVATSDEASASALARCKSGGGTQCTVQFSVCSDGK